MKNPQNQSSIIPQISFKPNKRQIPININSNPYPSQFIYNNKKSHLTNSYITIGKEIYKKQKNNNLSNLIYTNYNNNSQNSINNNLTQFNKISNNSFLNQSILDKKKLIISSNIVLNDYKERKPINSSFLIKYGTKKKSPINSSLNKVLKSNNKINMNENSKREKINSHSINKNNNLRNDINSLSKEKKQYNYESSIVTIIQNKKTNKNNNNKPEKNKENNNKFIYNIQRQILGLKKNDNSLLNSKKNIKSKNKNYSKEKKPRKNNNNNQPSNKIINFYKKNSNSLLSNFPKNQNSKIQNIKRDNKLSKLLKYKNNQNNITVKNNKTERENEEEKKGKMENNVHLRNSSKFLRENTTLLKIIEKKENNEGEEIKLMNNPNEILAVEPDLPLALDSFMISPLRENKENIYNNNNDFINKNCMNCLFEQSNLDSSSCYDDKFDNLKSVVKRIKFNKVIVNCGSFFSKNNSNYLKYIESFKKNFEEGNQFNQDNLNSYYKSDKNNISFNSTQPGSNKKKYE